MKKETKEFFDVIYTTKSGRTMVASRIKATTAKHAKTLLKKEMKESTSFKKVVTAIHSPH